MLLLHAAFKRSIKWNTIESVLYQIIFLSHQIILFKVADKNLYGLTATLLATLYAGVMIGNLGLDQTMGPFFSAAQKSRAAFKKIIGWQLLGQTFLLAMIATVLFLLEKNYFNLYSQLPTLPFALLALLLITEGLKKSLRTILQLAFMNHLTTGFEVAMISLYVLMVWGWYGMSGSLTLITLLTPLLATSLLSNLMLGLTTYAWYKKLHTPSAEQVTDTTALYGRIIKNRFLCSLSNTGQQLFSSNFLIPAIAAHSGLAQAGIFNLIATLTYSLTSIFHKIGGLTTQAILSRIKDDALSVKKMAFSFITDELLHIICSLLIFLSINSRKLVTLHKGLLTGEQWMIPAYLYLAIIFSDYLVVAYEKFFLNEELAHYLALFNGVTIAACSLLLSTGNYFGPSLFLAILLSIRMAGFAALSTISYRQWGIHPHFKPRAWYLGISMGITTLFYIIF